MFFELEDVEIEVFDYVKHMPFLFKHSCHCVETVSFLFSRIRAQDWIGPWGSFGCIRFMSLDNSILERWHVELWVLLKPIRPNLETMSSFERARILFIYFTGKQFLGMPSVGYFLCHGLRIELRHIYLLYLMREQLIWSFIFLVRGIIFHLLNLE